MATYTCFTRNWYTWEMKGTIKKLVPDPTARRTKIQTFYNEDQARQYCQQWNETHKPGPLSRKCEYTSNY
jgi:hypothetical protein